MSRQLALGSNDFPSYIAVYPWSAGFGTKYADPATLSAGYGFGVAFGDVGVPPLSVSPSLMSWGLKIRN